MKHVLLLLVVLLGIAGPASNAQAARTEDEGSRIEARLEGYKSTTPVKVPEASTALTWILFIVLTGVGLAALFKDAKRSHLD